MKVGDLVKFESTDPLDRRCIGTVLDLDVYRGKSTRLRTPEPMAEVLWNNMQTTWILQERVEVINECR